MGDRPVDRAAAPMTDAVRPRSTAPSDLAPVDTGDAPTIDGREVRGGSAWDVLGAGLRGSARVAAALASAQEAGTRQEWLVVVGECQGLVNSLTALQDVALAEVARRESDWGEDGSLGETVHGHGRVTLDAADLAAPALGASHVQAQRRLEQAVRLGVGRVPEDVDSPVARSSPAWGRCTPRWRPVASTATEPVSSRQSSSSLLPTWPRPSSPRSSRTSTTRAPCCGGAAGGCWPGSRPSCCASAH